jgi:peptidoglycan/LPS O-acetylase OafA/YrhL
MPLNILKFIHVLLALGLLSLTAGCLVLVGYKQKLTKFNKALLCLGFLALLTGTLLIYPTHYTLQTRWIQAAYLLLVIFMLGVGLLSFKKKYQPIRLYQFFYLLLLALLIIITHDAVRKNVFKVFSPFSGWVVKFQNPLNLSVKPLHNAAK